ncbi:MAG: hypothetical protein SH850_27875 [Planctomycetaceae bacterium]|nr:hypothetical protein [Planctomycetaceae bacterium]
MVAKQPSQMNAPQSAVWSRFAIVLFGMLCLTEAAKLVAFHQAGPMPRVSDAAAYWRLGTQVASGDIWMTDHAVAYRTPGYPWFLGLMQAACGPWAWCIAVAVQYVAVWLTTMLTGWWTWRVTGRPWLAVAAVAVCVLSAARASHASILLTETLFTLWLTLTGVLLCQSAALVRPRSTVVVAAVWCLAWITRPVAAALIPAWLVAWWWPAGDRSFMRTKSLAVALTAAVLAVGLGPWIVRNVLVWQRPALTVFLGRELWVTTFGPGQPDPPGLPATPEADDLVRRVSPDGKFTDWRGNWSVSNGLTASGLSDVAADELMGRVARQAIAADPLRAGQRGVWRAIDYWRATYLRSMADYDQPTDSEAVIRDEQRLWGRDGYRRFRTAWLESAPERRLLVTELASVLALLGLAGLWLSPATIRFAAIGTALVVGVALATAIVEYPAYRYRMVLEPVLIVCGISGWAILIDVIRRGRRSLWQESPP